MLKLCLRKSTWTSVLITVFLIQFSSPGHLHGDEVQQNRERTPYKSNVELYEDKSPAVAMVEARLPQENGEDKDSVGAAFLIDTQGHFLTNEHVIGEADSVTLKLANGRSITSTIIHRDKRTDLAIVKIKASYVKGIRPIVLVDGRPFKVGEAVAAIGSPYSQENSLTAGIISGRQRFLERTPYLNYLQTDAAINPGNSGGPLLCMNGTCIGVTNAILSETGSNSGVSFAISGEHAQFVSQQLIKNHIVVRGYMGAKLRQLDREKLDELNIESGFQIMEIMRNDTPAAKAGLLKDDIITHLNGERVTTVTDFVFEIARTSSGEKVNIKTLRGEKAFRRRVFVETHPDSIKNREEYENGERRISALKLSVETLDPKVAIKLGHKSKYLPKEGLLVTKVDAKSSAAEKGVIPGVIILEAEKKEVDKPGRLTEIIAQVSDDEGFFLEILNIKGESQYVVISR